MENVIKHWEIKLVLNDKRRLDIISEPNYHSIDKLAHSKAMINRDSISQITEY